MLCCDRGEEKKSFWQKMEKKRRKLWRKTREFQPVLDFEADKLEINCQQNTNYILYPSSSPDCPDGVG